MVFSTANMGLSENVGYIPNEITIFQNAIMISKTIGSNGVHSLFSDTPIYIYILIMIIYIIIYMLSLSLYIYIYILHRKKKSG